jgi:hypothetical protein
VFAAGARFEEGWENLRKCWEIALPPFSLLMCRKNIKKNINVELFRGICGKKKAN